MLDSELRLSLLEVNPGPDFKQTGTRLKVVINKLWESTCRVILDSDWSESSHETPPRGTGSLVKVYDKEWSVGMIKGGGMKLT
jgi:tubulin---tyrosine ligase